MLFGKSQLLFVSVRPTPSIESADVYLPLRRTKTHY
jgi:hypothetical protein